MAALRPVGKRDSEQRLGLGLGQQRLLRRRRVVGCVGEFRKPENLRN